MGEDFEGKCQRNTGRMTAGQGKKLRDVVHVSETFILISIEREL